MDFTVLSRLLLRQDKIEPQELKIIISILCLAVMKTILKTFYGHLNNVPKPINLFISIYIFLFLCSGLSFEWFLRYCELL
jgi:hypothetical protein